MITGTKFGAMLDQLTDRAGTAGLMMTLATFYPKYTFWFQMSMAIDITCHWIFLHTSTLQGKTSHKFIDMSENPIMHLYYTNKNVLFFMCAGNEAFYAALYVMYFYSGPTGILFKNNNYLKRFQNQPFLVYNIFVCRDIIEYDYKIICIAIIFSVGNGLIQIDSLVVYADSCCKGSYFSATRYCCICQPVHY